MIAFGNARIPMGRDKRLRIGDWKLSPGEVWVIAGAGGTGKSTLARAIAGIPDASGRIPAIEGLERTSPNEGCGAWISFDREKEIRAELRRDDDSEWSGRPDEGTALDEFLGGKRARSLLAPSLLEKLGGRGVRHLSTGEFRQVLIAREAARAPSLAVLDEPFEGLDETARPRLTAQLEEWAGGEALIVLTVNRRDDIPLFATGLALLDSSGLAAVGTPGEVLASAAASRVLNAAADPAPPADLPAAPFDRPSPSDPLIRMKDVRLAYGGREVLDGIDWTVRPGESWLLTGPNGSGKTTLMNLISGDEPRAFGQDLWLFGRKKGSGESTSEIKRNLGHVSSILQESVPDYSAPVEIVGSGLRDSFVASPPLDGFERRLSLQWLEAVGLEEKAEVPFVRLPYGERRLVMIARAMIKHPPLLLLDEPMHGLDSAARGRISVLVDRVVRGTETTVLFVSHRPEDAPDSIANHIMLIPGSGGGPSRARTGRRGITGSR